MLLLGINVTELYRTGPLACLSLSQVPWSGNLSPPNLVLPNKEAEERCGVKLFIWFNVYGMDVPSLNTFLRPILTVTSV